MFAECSLWTPGCAKHLYALPHSVLASAPGRDRHPPVSQVWRVRIVTGLAHCSYQCLARYTAHKKWSVNFHWVKKSIFMGSSEGPEAKGDATTRSRSLVKMYLGWDTRASDFRVESPSCSWYSGSYCHTITVLVMISDPGLGQAGDPVMGSYPLPPSLLPYPFPTSHLSFLVTHYWPFPLPPIHSPSPLLQGCSR